MQVKPPNKNSRDDDPYSDCSNHATHTTDILFANDSSGDTGFRGVAPRVSVEHYRVFDYNGMSTSDVVVRAVLLAYERGIDLINLSLGSGSRPFSDGQHSLFPSSHVALPVAFGAEVTRPSLQPCGSDQSWRQDVYCGRRR